MAGALGFLADNPSTASLFGAGGAGVAVTLKRAAEDAKKQLLAANEHKRVGAVHAIASEEHQGLINVAGEVMSNLKTVAPRDTDQWLDVCKRQYIRGRKFTAAHAIALRTVDFFAEIAWRKRVRRRRRPGVSLQNAVVIKPDHIGDLLMATPFLAAIKEQQKKSGGTLKLITGRWNAACAETLKKIGLCDSVEFVDFPFLAGYSGISGQMSRFAVDLIRVSRRLRRSTPTVAIDLRPFAPNGIPLALLAGADSCVGFGTRGFAKLLDIEFAYDAQMPTGQLFLSGLSVLGISSSERQYYLGPELDGLDSLASGDVWGRFGLTRNSYYVLHLESREAARELDSLFWEKVVDTLTRSRAGKPLVVVGARSNKVASRLCRHMSSSGIPFVSVVGQTTFEELALLCRKAVGAVCIDSAVAHLSISAKKPTLVLMANQASFRSSYPLPRSGLPLSFVTVNGRNAGGLIDALETFTRAVA